MNTVMSAPAAPTDCAPSALRERLVPQLQDAVLFWVTTRIDPVIGATEDALFELAVNAAGAVAQNRYFAAMQDLRAGRGRLVVGMQQELARRIALALAPAAPLRACGEPARDALAASAPRVEAVSAALERHEDTLVGLNCLLNGLLGTRRWDGATHSIAGPELLCASLVDACASMRLPADACSAVTAEFARAVLAELEQLCVLCAGLLVDAGVLPATERGQTRIADPRAALAERALRARLPCGADQTRRLLQQVFASVAGDARFVSRLRKALCALEGCVLEAAARDAEFFGNPAQPLRRAIADIAALGIGIGEADAAGDDGQLLEIETLVSQLRVPGCPRTEIERLLEGFAVWCASEQHRARLEQRRVEDSEQARVLAGTARSAIERVIAHELGAQRLPAAAEEMLREGFQRMLVHAWLRGGIEGADWRDALACLGSFMTLWRSGAARLPEALADRLRDGLLYAGCDPLRIEILLRGIDEELASWDPPAEQALGLVLVSEEEPRDVTSGPQRLAEIDALPRGTWLAFAPGVAAACRAQLALRCGDPQRLLFVGRYGQRAAVLSREELALLIASGRARLLDTSDPLELALRTLHSRSERRQENAA